MKNHNKSHSAFKRWTSLLISMLMIFSIGSSVFADDQTAVQNGIDKSVLTAKLSNAADLLKDHPVGEANGNVPQSTNDELTNAVTSSSAVNLDVNASQTQVDGQVVVLTQAINDFNGAIIIVDKSVLAAKLSEASDLLSSHQVGNASGNVPQSSYEGLASAVTTATAVSLDVNAVQAQVNGQVTALSQMITLFNSLIIIVDKSALAAKLSEAADLLIKHPVGILNGNVPASANDELTSAVTTATAVSIDVNAAQPQVNDQVNVLSQAIASFNSAIIEITKPVVQAQLNSIVNGDKSVLAGKISDAELLLNQHPVGSLEGNVSQDTYDTLSNSITAASYVNSDENATQYQINEQVSILTQAMSQFESHMINNGPLITGNSMNINEEGACYIWLNFSGQQLDKLSGKTFELVDKKNPSVIVASSEPTPDWTGYTYISYDGSWMNLSLRALDTQNGIPGGEYKLIIDGVSNYYTDESLVTIPVYGSPYILGSRTQILPANGTDFSVILNVGLMNKLTSTDSIKVDLRDDSGHTWESIVPNDKEHILKGNNNGIMADFSGVTPLPDSGQYVYANVYLNGSLMAGSQQISIMASSYPSVYSSEVDPPQAGATSYTFKFKGYNLTSFDDPKLKFNYSNNAVELSASSKTDNEIDFVWNTSNGVPSNGLTNGYISYFLWNDGSSYFSDGTDFEYTTPIITKRDTFCISKGTNYLNLNFEGRMLNQLSGKVFKLVNKDNPSVVAATSEPSTNWSGYTYFDPNGYSMNIQMRAIDSNGIPAGQYKLVIDNASNYYSDESVVTVPVTEDPFITGLRYWRLPANQNTFSMILNGNNLDKLKTSDRIKIVLSDNNGTTWQSEVYHNMQNFDNGIKVDFSGVTPLPASGQNINVNVYMNDSPMAGQSQFTVQTGTDTSAFSYDIDPVVGGKTSYTIKLFGCNFTNLVSPKVKFYNPNTTNSTEINVTNRTDNELDFVWDTNNGIPSSGLPFGNYGFNLVDNGQNYYDASPNMSSTTPMLTKRNTNGLSSEWNSFNIGFNGFLLNKLSGKTFKLVNKDDSSIVVATSEPSSNWSGSTNISSAGDWIGIGMRAVDWNNGIPAGEYKLVIDGVSDYYSDEAVVTIPVYSGPFIDGMRNNILPTGKNTFSMMLNAINLDKLSTTDSVKVSLSDDHGNTWESDVYHNIQSVSDYGILVDFTGTKPLPAADGENIHANVYLNGNLMAGSSQFTVQTGSYPVVYSVNIDPPTAGNTSYTLKFKGYNLTKYNSPGASIYKPDGTTSTIQTPSSITDDEIDFIWDTANGVPSNGLSRGNYEFMFTNGGFNTFSTWANLSYDRPVITDKYTYGLGKGWNSFNLNFSGQNLNKLGGKVFKLVDKNNPSVIVATSEPSNNWSGHIDFDSNGGWINIDMRAIDSQHGIPVGDYKLMIDGVSNYYNDESVVTISAYDGPFIASMRSGMLPAGKSAFTMMLNACNLDRISSSDSIKVVLNDDNGHSWQSNVPYDADHFIMNSFSYGILANFTGATPLPASGQNIHVSIFLNGNLMAGGSQYTVHTGNDSEMYYFNMDPASAGNTSYTIRFKGYNLDNVQNFSVKFSNPNGTPTDELQPSNRNNDEVDFTWDTSNGVPANGLPVGKYDFNLIGDGRNYYGIDTYMQSSRILLQNRNTFALGEGWNSFSLNFNGQNLNQLNGKVFKLVDKNDPSVVVATSAPGNNWSGYTNIDPNGNWIDFRMRATDSKNGIPKGQYKLVIDGVSNYYDDESVVTLDVYSDPFIGGIWNWQLPAGKSDFSMRLNGSNLNKLTSTDQIKVILTDDSGNTWESDVPNTPDHIMQNNFNYGILADFTGTSQLPASGQNIHVKVYLNDKLMTGSSDYTIQTGTDPAVNYLDMDPAAAGNTLYTIKFKGFNLTKLSNPKIVFNDANGTNTTELSASNRTDDEIDFVWNTTNGVPSSGLPSGNYNFNLMDNGNQYYGTGIYLNYDRPIILKKYVYGLPKGWQYFGMHFEGQNLNQLKGKVFKLVDKSNPLNVVATSESSPNWTENVNIDSNGNWMDIQMRAIDSKNGIPVGEYKLVIDGVSNYYNDESVVTVPVYTVPFIMNVNNSNLPSNKNSFSMRLNAFNLFNISNNDKIKVVLKDNSGHTWQSDVPYDADHFHQNNVDYCITADFTGTTPLPAAGQDIQASVYLNGNLITGDSQYTLQTCDFPAIYTFDMDQTSAGNTSYTLKFKGYNLSGLNAPKVVFNNANGTSSTELVVTNRTDDEIDFAWNTSNGVPSNGLPSGWYDLNLLDNGNNYYGAGFNMNYDRPIIMKKYVFGLGKGTQDFNLHFDGNILDKLNGKVFKLVDKNDPTNIVATSEPSSNWSGNTYISPDGNWMDVRMRATDSKNGLPEGEYKLVIDGVSNYYNDESVVTVDVYSEPFINGICNWVLPAGQSNFSIRLNGSNLYNLTSTDSIRVELKDDSGNTWSSNVPNTPDHIMQNNFNYGILADFTGTTPLPVSGQNIQVSIYLNDKLMTGTSQYTIQTGTSPVVNSQEINPPTAGNTSYIIKLKGYNLANLNNPKVVFNNPNGTNTTELAATNKTDNEIDFTWNTTNGVPSSGLPYGYYDYSLVDNGNKCYGSGFFISYDRPIILKKSNYGLAKGWTYFGFHFDGQNLNQFNGKVFKLVDKNNPSKVLATSESSPNWTGNVNIDSKGNWMDIQMRATDSQNGIPEGEYKLVIDGVSNYYNDESVVTVPVYTVPFIRDVNNWNLPANKNSFSMKLNAFNLFNISETDKIKVVLTDDSGHTWQSDVPNDADHIIQNNFNYGIIADFAGTTSLPAAGQNIHVSIYLNDNLVAGESQYTVQTCDFPTLYSFNMDPPSAGNTSYTLKFKGYNLMGLNNPKVVFNYANGTSTTEVAVSFKSDNEVDFVWNTTNGVPLSGLPKGYYNLNLLDNGNDYYGTGFNMNYDRPILMRKYTFGVGKGWTNINLHFDGNGLDQLNGKVFTLVDKNDPSIVVATSEPSSNWSGKTNIDSNGNWIDIQMRATDSQNGIPEGDYKLVIDGVSNYYNDESVVTISAYSEPFIIGVNCWRLPANQSSFSMMLDAFNLDNLTAQDKIKVELKDDNGHTWLSEVPNDRDHFIMDNFNYVLKADFTGATPLPASGQDIHVRVYLNDNLLGGESQYTVQTSDDPAVNFFDMSPQNSGYASYTIKLKGYNLDKVQNFNIAFNNPNGTETNQLQVSNRTNNEVDFVWNTSNGVPEYGLPDGHYDFSVMGDGNEYNKIGFDLKQENFDRPVLLGRWGTLANAYWGNLELVYYGQNLNQLKDKVFKLVRMDDPSQVVATSEPNGQWFGVTETDGSGKWIKMVMRATDAVNGLPEGQYKLVIDDATDYYINENAVIVQLVNDPLLNKPVNPLEVVNFNDPNLEMAVRSALYKNQGTITASDMARLTELYVDDQDISDLTGLQYAINIRNIGLSGNNIKDISILKQCNDNKGLSNGSYIDLSGNYIDLSANSTSGEAFNQLVNAGVNIISDYQLPYRAASNPLAVVTFSDPNLENAVRTQLNKTSGDITQADMAGLTTLYANSCDISSLEGLQYALNLRTLYLDNNKITDISLISNLQCLENLSLSSNKISSIAAAASLPYIKMVDLNNNEIVNIPPILANANFNNTDISLYINENFVNLNDPANMDVINNLTSKGMQISYNDQLTMPQNPGSVVTFNDIKLQNAVRDALNIPADNITAMDMAKLRILHADGIGIKDITGLEAAINLKKLILPNNRISDISALASLRALDHLDLSNNKISDINPVVRLSNLVSLKLSSNELQNIDPLTMLYNNAGSKLDTIDISYNFINANTGSNPKQVIDGLIANGVGTLYDNQSVMPANPNQAVTFADTNLENAVKDYLNITDGNVSVIDMYKIDALTADNSGIKKLTGLEYAVNLNRLWLSNNFIKDLTPLANLTKLFYLDLSGNSITDISALVANKLSGGFASNGNIILSANNLDLSQGSKASLDLVTLTSGGTNVIYDNQTAPQPGGTSAVEGFVKLQCRDIQYNPNGVRISLGTINNNVFTEISSVNVNTSDGHFEFDNLDPGQYTIQISSQGYVTRNINNVVLAADKTLTLSSLVSPILLSGGDINNDGAVNATDLSIVLDSFNKIFGNTGFNTNADLNGDKAVNATDLSVILGNFNTTSASYPSINN